MAIIDDTPKEVTPSPAKPTSRSALYEKLVPLALLLPIMIATLVFVYGFILLTVLISLSDWSPFNLDGGFTDPIMGNYADLFGNLRFQIGLRNTFVFTILFLFGAVGLGLFLAVLLDRKIPGSSALRSVFLFPYALSFIVTGVAWRWIFNPESGLNMLIDAVGINVALEALGFEPFKPGWLTDPSVWPPLNELLGDAIPWLGNLDLQLGIPVAMIAIVIAAVWQLSGFAMATYLAGLATIPQNLKEAAQIDAASSRRFFWKVTFPMLAPFTVINLIILGHTSLKIFDLVFVMSGPGPGFATDVPGIFVFEMTFKALRYGLGAAASVVMLVLVALVIVPYLALSATRGKQ